MSRKKAPSITTASADLVKLWSELTWDDLEAWTNSRSVQRGRAYQRDGHVTFLGITLQGRLLATVVGTEDYVTTAWRTDDRSTAGIESSCTCPVGTSGCKHAVAVVAEFLAVVARGEQVPQVSDDDGRWQELSGLLDDDADDDFDDDDLDEDGADGQPFRRPGRSRAVTSSGRTQSPSNVDGRIEAHVRSLGQQPLADLVMSLIQRYPELREEFRERLLHSEGSVTKLLAEARREMKRVTSERGWNDGWNGERHTPDYSKLQRRLERLVELGQNDAVVELGHTLIAWGCRQVGKSNDEGDTAMALAECLDVVFQAVRSSSLSGSAKILFAIDAYQQDDYDCLGEGPGKILDAEWPQSDWSVVADELNRRQGSAPKLSDENFHERFQYSRATHWLLMALENAGRTSELLAVHERNARATGDPRELVKFLIANSQLERADEWARQGLLANLQRAPGIASDLADTLSDLAASRKQWDVVAAHVAIPFFERPSREGFVELVKAAKKAKCEEAVRRIALRFLETGESPFQVIAPLKTMSSKVAIRPARTTAKKKGTQTPAESPVAPPAKTSVSVRDDWPLPLPDYLAPLLERAAPHREPRPHYGVLLNMALADKDTERVLHWFDKLPAQQRNSSYDSFSSGDGPADKVAQAVAKSHPDRALEIHRDLLNSVLPQTGIPAYEAAVRYLRLMRPLFDSLGRANEWTKLVTDIRLSYRNRPRFMEILDKLDGRTILEAEQLHRKK